MLLRCCRNPDHFKRKKDQCGILAQIFLLCGKLRLEVLRGNLFRTRSALVVKCRAGYCRVDDAIRTGRQRLRTWRHCERGGNIGRVRVRCLLPPRWGWINFSKLHPRLTPGALFLRRFAAWKTLAVFHMSARGSTLRRRSSSTAVDLRWAFAAQCARHLYS
jgi:hypothetical protein